MALLSQGYSLIAGLDEAGRGCLAGPVVAAAVILPLDDAGCAANLKGVRDSKQLTCSARESLYDVIMQHAVAVGVGMGSVELIDERNILQATKYAMRSPSNNSQRLPTRSCSTRCCCTMCHFPNAPSSKATRAASPSLPRQSLPKSPATASCCNSISNIPPMVSRNTKATAPKPTWPLCAHTGPRPSTGRASRLFANCMDYLKTVQI